MIEKKSDGRGWLAELIKDKDFGQINVVVAKPGVVRGNHYHKRKKESFFVIKGECEINLKNVNTGETKKLILNDSKIESIVIEPFWSHNIVNMGDEDLYIIAHISEIFDEGDPDTFKFEVKN
jgi:UDP-2-acetamido-2,6-beta-L-arabino-hexul-4-ose reductase